MNSYYADGLHFRANDSLKIFDAACFCDFNNFFCFVTNVLIFCCTSASPFSYALISKNVARFNGSHIATCETVKDKEICWKDELKVVKWKNVFFFRFVHLKGHVKCYSPHLLLTFQLLKLENVLFWRISSSQYECRHVQHQELTQEQVFDPLIRLSLLPASS